MIIENYLLQKVRNMNELVCAYFNFNTSTRK